MPNTHTNNPEMRNGTRLGGHTGRFGVGVWNKGGCVAGGGVCGGRRWTHSAWVGLLKQFEPKTVGSDQLVKP